MTSDTDRVLIELWPHWIPTSEEQSLWSESMARYSTVIATRAIRIHRTRTPYPSPTLSAVVEIADSLASAEAASVVAMSRSAEYAALADRCRQDADGHRMLVDSMSTDDITAVVERLRDKVGKVLGTMCSGPPSQWSRVECGLFAAQHDTDARNATIADLACVRLGEA